jgi:hypothetical protein
MEDEPWCVSSWSALSCGTVRVFLAFFFFLFLLFVQPEARCSPIRQIPINAGECPFGQSEAA